HVAVILDGNRRWANQAGLHEPGAGHRRGADKLSELIRWCASLGIGELTVWGLSMENLTRPSEEVTVLTQVLSEELERLGRHAGSGSDGIRIRVFGRLDALPAELAETARRVQSDTGNNEGICLNIALGYSGRDEIVAAAQGLVRSLVADGVPPG